ncbi:hypothetical protein [Pseudomonas sp. CMR5c]|uniref:hypothetical protein n=1 Tax=Pseudomonas sp. CMR5c TaxID=658630 RepID=UPI00069E5191|nr:hypothetical protein [Pseudomonas sp. CMR5c]AZC19558.1 hypothetical protein C4K40_4177 [Pseudomonas sp. CMR5c]
MSDQNDVIGDILDEMQRITDAGTQVSEVVIHDAGLWTRLPGLAGPQLESVVGGMKLFGVRVVLGGKNDSAKFTVKPAP